MTMKLMGIPPVLLLFVIKYQCSSTENDTLSASNIKVTPYSGFKESTTLMIDEVTKNIENILNSTAQLPITETNTTDKSITYNCTPTFKQGEMQCLSTPTGFEYNGTLGCTESGYQCRSWIEVNSTDDSIIQKIYLPDETIKSAQQYCRNPEYPGLAAGPWCLIDPIWDGKNKEMKYLDFCDIPFCMPSMVYTGTISETYRGMKCQRWSSQTPHEHYEGSQDADFLEKDIEAASNYCRNPDSDPRGPW